jgi:hypothetical protein
MPTVTLHIWHNPNDGQIIAIGRAPADTKHKVIPVAGQNQAVLETQIKESEIKTLHESHRVDVHTKTLVRATSSRTASNYNYRLGGAAQPSWYPHSGASRSISIYMN